MLTPLGQSYNPVSAGNLGLRGLSSPKLTPQKHSEQVALFNLEENSFTMVSPTFGTLSALRGVLTQSQAECVNG